MDEEEKAKKAASMATAQLEEYKLSFKNGALANLKRLATRFNVPDDDLNQVVSKATKLLTYVKDAKDGKVSFSDQKGDRYFVNINEL